MTFSLLFKKEWELEQFLTGLGLNSRAEQISSGSATLEKLFFESTGDPATFESTCFSDFFRRGDIWLTDFFRSWSDIWKYLDFWGEKKWVFEIALGDPFPKMLGGNFFCDLLLIELRKKLFYGVFLAYYSCLLFLSFNPAAARAFFLKNEGELNAFLCIFYCDRFKLEYGWHLVAISPESRSVNNLSNEILISLAKFSFKGTKHLLLLAS